MMRVIQSQFCCLSIVLFLSPSLAFGQGQVLHETLMHDGVERDYILYVPSTYSAEFPLPLVFNLHGRFGNAAQQMTSSAMNAVAEQEGFLVTYPDSIDGAWDMETDSDVRFVETLLGTLSSEYSVDVTRVYSTGYSQGGVLSYVLATTRPYTFAAIAPVAGFRRLDADHEGSGYIPWWAPRRPPRPFPLMLVHGTDDRTVPPGGGVGILGGGPFPSLADTLSEWLACNECIATPFQSELPDISSVDDSTVSFLLYANCATYLSTSGEEIAAEVLYYRVNGGRHSWPVLEADRSASLAVMEATYGTVSMPYILPLNSDFSASAAIWDFFQQHTVAITYLNGDFNKDWQVDGRDFLLWQRDQNVGPLSDWEAHFSQRVESMLTLDQGVPEPATLLLGCAALAVFGALSRRR